MFYFDVNNNITPADQKRFPSTYDGTLLIDVNILLDYTHISEKMILLVVASALSLARYQKNVVPDDVFTDTEVQCKGKT